jgi:hypothetical protein
MKKIIVSLVALFVFMISVPLTAEAHCPYHRRAKRTTYSRNYARSYPRTYYATPRYRTAGYAYTRRPSFYRRHRNVINVGIGTGAGALIGGIARGRRGAGIGALLGGGGGALYTYVLNKKRRQY